MLARFARTLVLATLFLGLEVSVSGAAEFALKSNKIGRDIYGAKVRVWEGTYRLAARERLDSIVIQWRPSNASNWVWKRIDARWQSGVWFGSTYDQAAMGPVKGAIYFKYTDRNGARRETNIPFGY